MKNILLKSAMFIAVLLLMSANYKMIANPDDPTPEEIAIKNATSSIDPERERSIFAEVEAFFYRSANEIELTFNYDLGSVTIQIVNQYGYIACSMQCNTAVCPTITIKTPSAAGSYTVIIAGDTYYGTGTFVID